MGIRVRRRSHFTLELTPLIDVVFLLLVFFLVATTFHKMEREMSISVPDSDTGQEGKKESETVVVNVLGDGRVVVEGNTVDLDQLQSLLARRNERAQAVKALVRGHKDIPYETVVQVVDACRKAKVGISLATLEK